MAEQTLPSPAALLVKPDGRPDDTWYQRLTLMWKAFNAGRASLSDDIQGGADDAIDARIATQAEQEAGSSLLNIVTPGQQQHHQSAAKCWGVFNFAAAISASYNITSIADTGTGIVSVTIATDFSSADWAPLNSGYNSGAVIANILTGAAITAGTVRLGTFSDAGSAADVTLMNFAGFGDQ